MSEIDLTIKPTLSCNMRCRHCFNGDDLNTSGIIDINIVFNLLEKACKDYNEVKITFHGGEPSLAGKDFYEKFFEYENLMKKKYNTKFRNFFTTNGLILDDNFVDILIANDVMINVSYDGPYNSVLRQNGDKVLNNIKMIQRKNGRIRCFCTLSKDSYSNLFDIYKWFNNNKLDFKTLPIEKRGYAKENQSLIMDSDKLVEELVKVYRYWIKDKNCEIRYFTFEEFASLRRDTQFKHYWFNRTIALNPDGKLYPFGRPNDVHYCIGEPSKVKNLGQCFNTDEYQRLLKILRNLYDTQCINCESLEVCNGVAICMSYMYVDDEKLLKYSCNQSNKIFSNILKVNDEIIEDFKNGLSDKYSNIIKDKFSEYGRKK